MEKISHAAVLVVIRQGKQVGEIELVSFLYTEEKDGRPPFSSWKFPVESSERGETRWATAANGVVRELSKNSDNPEGFNFRAIAPKGDDGEPLPFLVSRVRGDRNKGDDWHDKCVFILEVSPASVSMFRTEPKPDGPGETIGPPEYIEASELWRLMCERGQPFHRTVLYRVIQHLSDRSVDTHSRYREILEDPRSQAMMIGRGGPIRFM